MSVVIPTYQRRDFVMRAVESVLAQSFRYFELIVVDDGSTDGTREALAAHGGHVRYHRQENRGVSAARNAGVQLARAPVVAFLDSDDRWLPEHLAVLTEALARCPEAVLASTCPQSHAAQRAGREPTLLDAFPLLFVGNVIACPSCAAVRREPLLAVGGFDEALVVLEDLELWLRLAARGPFALVKRRTFVKQHTVGSLLERGSRRGAYIESIEAVARRAVAETEQLERPDAAELAERAQGSVRYAEALRALAGHDHERARRALAAACRLLPELSRQPAMVARRIAHFDLAERSSHLAAAARLWPEPRSDTALFLCGYAALLAAREGRIREAAALVRRRPTLIQPRVVARTLPHWVRLARSTLEGYRHRGRESFDLVAGLSAPGSRTPRSAPSRGRSRGGSSG